MAGEGWVAIALLGRARGNRGEVTAFSLSSHPERFAVLREVFLFGPGEAYAVQEVWSHQGTLVFKFAGVDTISDAEKLAGFEVRVPAAARVTLEEGTYFHSDLVGCRVVDAAGGEVIGTVQAVQELSGAGVLELESGVLIPFAKEICVLIDPQNRTIAVNLPEGLLELNRV